MYHGLITLQTGQTQTAACLGKKQLQSSMLFVNKQNEYWIALIFQAAIQINLISGYAENQN